MSRRAAAMAEMVNDCPAAKEQFLNQDGLMWLIATIDDADGGSPNITAATFLVSQLCKNPPPVRRSARQGHLCGARAPFTNPDNDEQEGANRHALYSLADSNEANQKAIREAGATARSPTHSREVLDAEPDNNFALALLSFAMASPAAAMEEEEE